MHSETASSRFYGRVLLVAVVVAAAATASPCVGQGVDEAAAAAAPHAASPPTQAGAPTVVHVALYVLDIDGIDSAQQTFTAGLFLVARWHDPRLAHEGLTMQRPLDEVWHPRLQLLNQQRLFTTFPENVEVLGRGDVIYRQRYWGSFSQPLQLQTFPFDHQVIGTQVLAAGYSQSEVRIEELVTAEGAKSGIAPRFSLPDWDVVNWTAKAGPVEVMPGQPGVPGLSFSIEVARQIGYYIVKIILPLSLIVAMSWISFWIDPEEISVNVSVAITSVLTIVAYCFAIGTSLPKLSYLTRMDAFILGSMLMVFLTVAQVVINSALVKRGHKHIAHLLDRGARWAYPLVFSGMTYWTLFRWW